MTRPHRVPPLWFTPPTHLDRLATPSAAFNEGALEFRMRELPPRVIPALVTEDRELLFPVEEVLSFTGVPFRRDGDRLRAARPRGEGENVLDIEQRLVHTPGPTLELHARDLVVHDGALYLSPAALGALLEATLDADWTNLLVTIERRDGEFPAQTHRRVQQERERALRLRRPDTPVDAASTPFHAHTGGTAIEWNVTSAGAIPVRPVSASSRVGFSLLGGELVSGLRWADSEGSSLRAHDTSYQRVFPEGSLVREVRLGDVFTPGFHREALRGFVLTNVPRIRDRHFDVLSVRPDLPLGWEYEVYAGNDLVGFSEVEDGEGVDVPLRYGTTPLRIRMIGPAGEVVESQLHYQVPRDLLRRGTLEYVAAGGQCRTGNCDWMSWGEARYGALSTLTLGGGARYSTDSLGANLRPTFTAVWMPGSGWNADAEIIPGITREASISHNRPNGVSGTVSAGVRGRGFQPLSPLEHESERWFTRATVGGPIELGPLRSLRLSGLLEGSRGETPDRIRVSSHGSVDRVFLEATYESAPYLSRDLLTLRTSLGHLGPLRRIGGRASLGVAGSKGGLRMVDVGMAFSPFQQARMDLRAQWRPGIGTGLTVSYSASTQSIRIRSRSSLTSAGDVSSQLGIGGGIAVDRETGLHTSSRQMVHASGIKGRVFYDHSGDGVFGPEDELATGVPVRIGGFRTETDRHGLYRVWAVRPYEVVAVQIDSIAIADPGWVPLRPEVLVRASPHMFTRVDIPLVRTREVFGRVEVESGEPPTGGITLVVENTENGESNTTTTFRDGSFYLQRLRPGSYRITVAESSLAALGGKAKPEEYTFVLAASDESPLLILETPIRIESVD